MASDDGSDLKTEAWTPEQRAALREEGMAQLEAAATDDRTVPLTAEMREQLRREGMQKLAARDAQAAPPADEGRTEHLTPAMREQLRQEGMKRLAEQEASQRPPSSVHVDMDQSQAAFQDPARTHALDEEEPAPPPPRGPAPSPTHFEIDVPSQLFRGEAPGAPPTTAPALEQLAPGQLAPGQLAPEPPATRFDAAMTEFGEHGKDSLAKTAFVDMRQELSQGTGLIKLVLALGIGVGIALGTLIMLSR